MMPDEWHSMTQLEQNRQLARDIAALHAAMQELVEEHDWTVPYLVAVTGGWLNFVFGQCFSDTDFYSFVDKLMKTHKARGGHG